MRLIFLFLSVILCNTVFAAKSLNEFEKLKIAYPDTIQEITKNYIAWPDGKRMQIKKFGLTDKYNAKKYRVDKSIGSISKLDVRHDSFEPFFRKMYGNSPREVEKKLVTIYWLKNLYGKKYPLRVTTVNNVHKKLERISENLEKLPVKYHKYVKTPASGYYWRNVAKESYLSMHSFGIAIDINVKYSNYWLWDYMKSKKTLTHLTLNNKIPMEIVEIFENEGFRWGGRWYHYDTMHFEYRPDEFV